MLNSRVLTLVFMDQSPFRSVVADHSADAAITPMRNAGAVTSITERRIEPTSRALKRFRELVRQRRSLLPRKERADWSSIYAVATLRQRRVHQPTRGCGSSSKGHRWSRISRLRQVLEQVSLEMNAGIYTTQAKSRLC